MNRYKKIGAKVDVTIRKEKNNDKFGIEKALLKSLVRENLITTEEYCKAVSLLDKT